MKWYLKADKTRDDTKHVIPINGIASSIYDSIMGIFYMYIRFYNGHFLGACLAFYLSIIYC